ncbi:MAG: undecaprenyl-diphosphatase UppP [Rhodothermaceae bacterium]
MSIIEAIILGIIQGLTEFLPISSTGHLTAAGSYMGLVSQYAPEQWTAFIAVIQLGTLLAVFIYFRKDLFNITKDFIVDNLLERKKIKEQGDNSKMGWFIILGSIPVVIVGLGFKDLIEGAFTKNLNVIGVSLIVLGIILAVAEKTGKFKKDMKAITWKDALIIGIAQCFALIPGSSRSGTTITAGLFTGLKRDTAARFSFLLGVPAILGSGLLQFYKSLEYLDSSGFVTLSIATIASAISGYLTIEFLLRFLKSNSTYIFVIYRIVFGALILYLVNQNFIIP